MRALQACRAVAGIVEAVNFIVIFAFAPCKYSAVLEKDLDSNSAGLRRYNYRGMLQLVIPAKAGIQCWRIVVRRIC